MGMSPSTIVTLEDLAERGRDLSREIEKKAVEKKSYEIAVSKTNLILFRESLCDLNLGSREDFVDRNDPVLVHKIESCVLSAMRAYNEGFRATELGAIHLYSILRFEVHTLNALSKISACKNANRVYRVHALALAFSVVNEKPKHKLLTHVGPAFQITQQK